MATESSIFYLGTDSNKILVVELNAATGNLVNIVQEISPVAPNPLELPEGVYNGIATEWISRHPKFPLLYALTSYWNAKEARVTTFRINEDDPTQTTTKTTTAGSRPNYLTQLGEAASTRGYHAAHATFSPDGSLYVIAHHNDGKLVFFYATNDNTALVEPCQIIDTPEVVPGSRRTTKRLDAFPGLPSLHHVEYTETYLLTVDPSQDCIFSYPIDKKGFPTSLQPTSVFRCSSGASPAVSYGWFQRIITKYVLKCRQRVRKAVVHPNGKYVYMVYESTNRLQVFGIDKQGNIDASKCWQDVSTIDDSLTSSSSPSSSSSSSSSWCPNGIIGVTLQLASELYISKDGSRLFVSNRGDIKIPGSRGESSIRVFSLRDEGRTLVNCGTLPGVSGPVRHFLPLLVGDCNDGSPNRIVAGVYQDQQYLQTFAKKGNGDETRHHTSEYELIGEAYIGANVFCISR